jgi:hypothetical protein
MIGEPARVLSWITPAQPWGGDAPELPAERAAHSALLAVADFFVAIHQLKTVEEALRLHRLIEEVLASVDTASRAALERADRF